MYLQSLLVPFVSALLTSTVAAAPTKRGPPSLKVCDHPGVDESVKPCIVDVIEWDVCRPIPDSNNKGDEGSTYEFLDGTPTMACRFYRSDTNCVDDWIPMLAQAKEGESSGKFPNHLTGKAYFRMYKCHDWMREEFPKIFDIPDKDRGPWW